MTIEEIIRRVWAAGHDAPYNVVGNLQEVALCVEALAKIFSAQASARIPKAGNSDVPISHTDALIQQGREEMQNKLEAILEDRRNRSKNAERERDEWKARAEKAVRERDAAIEVLRSVEWSGDFCDDPACPYCLHRAFKGHAKDCLLAELLGMARDE